MDTDFLPVRAASADMCRPARDSRASSATPGRVLVFTHTAGFRHDSIPVTVETLQAMGRDTGLDVDTTEDPAMFDDATLSPYAAVVFAHTTREVLARPQQAAFERYVADRDAGRTGAAAR